MLNIICCLILAVTSGVAMDYGYPFEGSIGFITSVIFTIGLLNQSSKEEFF